MGAGGHPLWPPIGAGDVDTITSILQLQRAESDRELDSCMAGVNKERAIQLGLTEQPRSRLTGTAVHLR
jgi:hypothetical protein